MALRQVYEFYHLDPDTQILLYAPSFAANLPDRDDLVSLTANITAWKQVLSDLTNTTGKRWVLMYRTHHFAPASCDTTNELFIDGNRYDDIQPLLLAAAMLVTDYSSCMWDYALTDRPILSYRILLKLMSSRIVDFSFRRKAGPTRRSALYRRSRLNMLFGTTKTTITNILSRWAPLKQDTPAND